MEFQMRNKTFISSMVVAAAVAVAGSANQTFAATLDFTGWTSYGASNVQGTWARFNLTATPYNIYTRSFVYDGSSLAGSAFSAGDVIVAIGADSVTGWTGFGGTGWKFQIGGTPTQPWYAGNVAANTSGRSSIGGSAAGSFTLQSSNSGLDLNLLKVMQSGNTMSSGAFLQSSTFARVGTESMQIYLNTSTLSAESQLLGQPAIPAFTPGSTINTAFYAVDGSLQETLVNITVVPAPGALALLGVAGLAGGRRRRA